MESIPPPCGLLLGDELDAFFLSSTTDLLLLGGELEPCIGAPDVDPVTISASASLLLIL